MQQVIHRNVNSIMRAIMTHIALTSHTSKTLANKKKIKLPVGMSINNRAFKAVGV
jgi:hypothetical protein